MTDTVSPAGNSCSGAKEPPRHRRWRNGKRLQALRSIVGLSLAVCTTAAAAQDCSTWQAVFESVDGLVEVQEAESTLWKVASQGDVACSQTTVRVDAFGRATLRLPDNSLISLSASSHLTIGASQDGAGSLIDILLGIIHVISRDPRSLRFNTPYANAGLEGTEFDIEVDEQQTAVTVIEGEVLLSNESGRLYIPGGQRGTARGSFPLQAAPVSNRFERAEWTPYFEPILQGPLPAADARPGNGANGQADFFAGRAAQRLSVGAVAAASADLAIARQLNERHADTAALQAMVALAQGDKAKAAEYAAEAVEFDPDAAAPLLARAYVEQSQLALSEARRSLQQAVQLEPDNAIAWARLAEIRLASGEYLGALGAATQALNLDSRLARAHTVLGFALLSQTDARSAETTFRRAVALKQASPLPRLGLGLALIRQGKLEEGRLETEVAVIQDPQNALTRSYMARIYAEQHRDALTATQLELARLLDPSDPTAFIYEALNKQSLNNPVEALQAYQVATKLNHNRARYRSTLLVDDDLAVRSAGFGQLYRQLGFEQLALTEGWKSTLDSPDDYSGHRLLFDVYASLPGHEIARASELLLSQMLQPINLTPVQPQLAEANLFLVDRRGPSELGFKEYGSLISQNGSTVQLSAIGADRDTSGIDLVVAGLQDNLSYSVGYFDFDTDGFRDNNDLHQQLANAFIQYRQSRRTSLQAELRANRTRKGDLALLYDRDRFNALRQQEDIDTARFGVRHDLSADSTLLGSLIYEDLQLSTTSGQNFGLDSHGSSRTFEVRHLYRHGNWYLNTGLRHYEKDQSELSSLRFDEAITQIFIQEFGVEHSSLYAYGDYLLSPKVTATFGASADRLRGQFSDNDLLNPKVGLMWEPSERTTLRLSAFRTLQGPVISRQNIQPRLEPTHVSGFNQFFFGPEGDEAWRVGLAVDHRINARMFTGVEVSGRNLDRQAVALMPDLTAQQTLAIDEDFYRAYLYWAPRPTWSFSAEYRLERIDGDNVPQPQGYTELHTRRLPIQMNFFHSYGLSTGIKATYIDQYGNFSPMTFGTPDTAEQGGDNFVLYDLSLNYRLPRRHGSVSLNVDNIFDESFRFQDMDPENPSIVPERMISLRFTVSY